MKANKRQKEILEQIRSILNFWATSNDITSPTHINDVDETFDNLSFLSELREKGGFEEKELEPIKEKIIELYWEIRKIKEK